MAHIDSMPTEGLPDENLLPGASALIGVDSNAFPIMFEVSSILKKAGASREYIEAYRTLCLSGDYDELLGLSMAVIGG